jgi:F-type H+-transporting ATPase subunit epsilon
MAEIRSDKIQLEIVTPKGRALSVVADEVTAPSVDGEFGVMPGHLPLLAALKTGIVTWRTGGETKRAAVGAGFAEAGPNKVSILTDEYIEREGIDPVVVRKELHEVQAEIAKVETAPRQPDDVSSGGTDNTAARLGVLVARENWLAAQLELYGDPPPPTMRMYETFGPPPPPEEDEVPLPSDAPKG